MIRAIKINCAIVLKFRQISVVGESLANESKSPAYFEVRSGDVAEMHPKIRTGGRNVGRLRTGICIARCKVDKIPKPGVSVRCIEIYAYCALGTEDEREFHSFCNLLTDGFDLIRVSWNWRQEVIPIDVVDGDSRVASSKAA